MDPENKGCVSIKSLYLNYKQHKPQSPVAARHPSLHLQQLSSETAAEVLSPRKAPHGPAKDGQQDPGAQNPSGRAAAAARISTTLPPIPRLRLDLLGVAASDTEDASEHLDRHIDRRQRRMVMMNALDYGWTANADAQSNFLRHSNVPAHPASSGRALSAGRVLHSPREAAAPQERKAPGPALAASPAPSPRGKNNVASPRVTMGSLIAQTCGPEDPPPAPRSANAAAPQRAFNIISNAGSPYVHHSSRHLNTQRYQHNDALGVEASSALYQPSSARFVGKEEGLSGMQQDDRKCKASRLVAHANRLFSYNEHMQHTVLAADQALDQRIEKAAEARDVQKRKYYERVQGRQEVSRPSVRVLWFAFYCLLCLQCV